MLLHVLQSLAMHGEDVYTYDAFVSYADEELRFVKYQMIEELEKKAGLSLCIHHRDYIPGL
jgi:hypothetical protein